MDVVAAEGCSCVADGWFPSPLFMLLSIPVLLAGSWLAARRLRRRMSERPGDQRHGSPHVAKAGLVAVTLPPPEGDGRPAGTDVLAGRDSP